MSASDRSGFEIFEETLRRSTPLGKHCGDFLEPLESLRVPLKRGALSLKLALNSALGQGLRRCLSWLPEEMPRIEGQVVWFLTRIVG